MILIKGSDFVFESVHLLSYSVHKISLKKGKSYTKAPEWVINKRTTINPKNKDNKFFQYSITVALNHKTLKAIQQEYQILNSLIISLIGKV